MNAHNFPLGPAKPGDGPTPDRDRTSWSRSGTPIGPMAPTANGVEIGLQGGQQHRPRIVVRPLSPISPGPAALRNAMLDMCLALAAGLGSSEEWTPAACKARAMAGPLGLIQAHDMQVRRK